MEKHTPGPWIAKRSGNCSPSFGVVIESGELLVGGARLSECEANAHLIAAAPDLLSALKSCLSAIDQNAYLAPRGSSLDEAFIKARAAIAKATGSKS